MKAHQSNTDRTLAIHIYANGTQCPEYTLGSLETDQPNILNCFVPVKHGDQLTVKGTFHGTVLNAVVDLLADGAFVRDTRIDGKEEPRLYKKRSIRWDAVYDQPNDGTSSLFSCFTIVEGPLHVTAIDSDPPEHKKTKQQGKKAGVGCISIIASMNMSHDEEHYQSGYEGLTVGECAGDPELAEHQTGVRATNELEVKVIDAGKQLGKGTQEKHKRHHAQTRPGTKPWVRFNFHYRTHDALDAARCELLSATYSHALEPSDVLVSTSEKVKVDRIPEKSVLVKDTKKAIPESALAKKPSNKILEAQTELADDESTIASGDHTSWDNRSREDLEPLFMPEKSPLMKKKRRSLFVGGLVTASPNPETNTHSQEDQVAATAQQQEGMAFGMFQTHWERDHIADWLQECPLEPCNKTDSDVAALLAGAEVETVTRRDTSPSLSAPSAPVVKMLPLSGQLPIEKPCDERLKPDAIDNMSGEKNIDSATDCSPDVPEKSIEKDGATQYMQQGESEKTLEAQPKVPRSGLDEADGEHRQSQHPNTTELVRFGQRNSPSPQTPSKAISPHRPITPMSLKRAPSISSVDSTGSPTKLTKLNEVAVRKRKIIADLEAKRKRKHAEQLALEMRRKHRHEEVRKREEAELRELEMLERMALAEDEEILELERANEAEEQEIDQERRARKLIEDSMGIDLQT